MDASANAVALQRKALARHARCADAWRFFNVLTGEQLLETAEATLSAHRERLFPPDGDAVDVPGAGAER